MTVVIIMLSSFVFLLVIKVVMMDIAQTELREELRQVASEAGLVRKSLQPAHWERRP